MYQLKWNLHFYQIQKVDTKRVDYPYENENKNPLLS